MNLIVKTRSRVRYTIEIIKFLYLQRKGGLSIPSRPEFDDETLERFRLELARASSYLEYGSGGSTLMADAAGIPALSVESDSFYAEKVRRMLKPGTHLQLAVPTMGLTQHWGMPVFNAKRKGYPYVTAPFDLMDGWFPDLVLVDGRYRVACVLEVARRAKIAGASATVILDDYSGRNHYHCIERHLSAPTLVGRSAIFHVGRQAVQAAHVSAHISDPR